MSVNIAETNGKQFTFDGAQSAYYSEADDRFKVYALSKSEVAEVYNQSFGEIAEIEIY